MAAEPHRHWLCEAWLTLHGVKQLLSPKSRDVRRAQVKLEKQLIGMDEGSFEIALRGKVHALRKIIAPSAFDARDNALAQLRSRYPTAELALQDIVVLKELDCDCGSH